MFVKRNPLPEKNADTVNNCEKSIKKKKKRKDIYIGKKQREKSIYLESESRKTNIFMKITFRSIIEKQIAYVFKSEL